MLHCFLKHFFVSVSCYIISCHTTCHKFLLHCFFSCRLSRVLATLFLVLQFVKFLLHCLISCGLLQILGVTLPFDKLTDVRARLAEISPTFDHEGIAEESGFEAVTDQIIKVRMMLSCTG